MIYSTATVPVNPAGKPKPTRAQAWAGLELKARDARLKARTFAEAQVQLQRGWIKPEQASIGIDRQSAA